MFIIDRLEGDLVILEYEGKTYELPRKVFPHDIKEGNIVMVEFKVDKEGSEKRLDKIKKLEDELFE